MGGQGGSLVAKKPMVSSTGPCDGDSVCLDFSFSICAMGPAVGPILGCHSVPQWRSYTIHDELQKGDSYGRKKGMRRATATHLGHRRPSAFWNQAETPSRPACGFQRAHQGHRSSGPLGTCPAGLRE